MKLIKNTITKILRRFGYLKVDYGFACGRHWLSIDGKTICQTNCLYVCLLVCCLFLISGCANQINAINLVKEKFPNCEMQQIPNCIYQWIVVSSNSVIWAESYGYDVTYVELFKLDK